ncbi:MAG: hypothetical protein A3B38_02355 [Candidatus Levybacteria bacterium RIFCSPLOWO2_01_FULL_36_13]|nr:MAG: hypothetical protein A2684_03550 [Candidatus Levybacteria bacterium RIFCSPHIGHO2_01_FULL_36_15b]OGH35129.1 MAG: hypothetical protein A3B38_02355 [Candidatus Levybacteria bacterium RIFCSPLOWO2_01_FULL_36_13]
MTESSSGFGSNMPEKLRSPEFEDRFLWGAEPDNSVDLTLANILKERGIKGIAFERKTRENDGGEYTNIYVTTDKARMTMNKITEMPEIGALSDATYPGFSLDEPDFDKVTIEEFKNVDLQNRLKALFCKNTIADFETWPDDGLEVWEDNSNAMNVNHYTEEMEEYLRFSTPSTVPDDDEIKALIELIVDSQGIPRREKEATEEVIVVDSKSTLSANEVADLDPYNVRGKPIQNSPKQLLEEKETLGELEIWGSHIPESSNLILAELLQEAGFQDIGIKDAKDGKKDIYCSDNYTRRIINSTFNFSDFQILSQITGGYPNELPDFSKAEFSEFKNEITQRRLKGLRYDILIKEYIRSCQRKGIPINANAQGYMEASKSDALIYEITPYGTAPQTLHLEIPDRKELKNWIREIISTL